MLAKLPFLFQLYKSGGGYVNSTIVFGAEFVIIMTSYEVSILLGCLTAHQLKRWLEQSVYVLDALEVVEK